MFRNHQDISFRLGADATNAIELLRHSDHDLRELRADSAPNTQPTCSIRSPFFTVTLLVIQEDSLTDRLILFNDFGNFDLTSPKLHLQPPVIQHPNHNVRN